MGSAKTFDRPRDGSGLATATPTLPFAGIAPRLRPGGVFAFSVEKDDEPGYRLRPNGRYTHNLDYLLDAGRAAGMRPLSHAEATLRTEHSQPVIGLVIALTVDPGPISS